MSPLTAGLSWPAGLLATALLLFGGGCRKEAGSGAETLAVIPFENLTADRSIDWIGRASAEVLADQLGTSGRFRAAVFTAGRAQAAAFGAKRFIGGFYTLEKGRLRIDCWLQEGPSGKLALMIHAGGQPAGGLLGLLGTLAREIDSAAKPYATTNEQALRALAEARSAPDAAAAAQAYQRAIKLDASFGPAYLGWLQLAASRRDREQAERVLGLAQSAADRLRPADRAALELERATLRGDAAARARALAQMARERPDDPGVISSNAESEMAAHRFEQGAALYRRLVTLTPENPAAWNVLGYAEALSGRLDAGLEALRHYQALSPNAANPFDSLGDVYYNAGRFADAERAYREAFTKEPAGPGANSLAKAAVARLVTGDVAGASAIFDEYAAARQEANDPSVEFRRAQWLYLSGHRDAALKRMAEVAGGSSLPALKAQASAQLALWLLEANRREAAAKSASAAGSAALGAVVRFLTGPPAPASEWAVRGERAFPDPKMETVKQLAVGYALLIGREFVAAAPLWRQINARADRRSPDDSGILYAWALIESNQWDGVEALLSSNGFPQPAGAAPFSFLSFPRLFELRARLWEKRGNAAEAARNRRLFTILSGQGK